MLTIANLSGGRDSTAMVIRYLELGNNRKAKKVS